MKFRVLISLILLSLGASQQLVAQTDTAALRKKVEAKEYVFVAQTASPLRGRLIQLTSTYDLRVSVDSVISALPYYGRAYSAPIGNNDGGFNFTSVKFDYKSVWKKNKWEIAIKPQDYKDINEMSLTIFNNGRASLRVSSNSRQSISYDGYISMK